ncbi:MAG: glycosyltransferase family 2 protein [Planctomycetes bacterium]|nr:glycosyltransferase family 2 protein [Planctomycetota bacterium]
MNTWAVIPVRNEESRLGGVLAALREQTPDLRVLVVDDGSHDASGRVARAGGATVVRHPFHMGYGAALQTGFKYVLSHGGRTVVTLDGDGQHDPACVRALLVPVEAGTTDLAVGSRFLGPDPYPIGFARRTGVALFRLLARLLTGLRITDPTSGYQALSEGVVRFCATDAYPHDYPDTDHLLALKKAGFRIVEVPVRMFPRASGTSMHGGLRPVYYAFKVLVSMLAVVLREGHSYLDVPDSARPRSGRGPADRGAP